MKSTYKVIRCLYCGTVVAKIRKSGSEVMMSDCDITITGDGVYYGRCGKKLPEDITKELSIVADGYETIFGLGFTGIGTGLDEE